MGYDNSQLGLRRHDVGGRRGQQCHFRQQATVSTIPLGGDRTAGTIAIGNATHNYNYTFTESGVTLNGTLLAFAGDGDGVNDSQDHLPSHTILNGSLNHRVRPSM